jgi:endonuclease/exonuclease/phosphatase family metal-dependent hydrolase
VARITPLVLLGVSLALTAPVFLIGVIRPLPQRTLMALLSATAVAGLASLVLGIALNLGRFFPAWRPSPLLSFYLVLAGCGAWVVVGAVVVGVLHVPSGPVSVVRFEGGTVEETAPASRLRLVDLNVLHGYPDFAHQAERRERLLRALRALDADILVLQEVWSATGYGDLGPWLAEELGMDLAYARANGSRRWIGFEEGSAVLSRRPILSARRWVLVPKKPPWETRIALAVEVEVREGEIWTVVGVHLVRDEGDVRRADVRRGQALDLAQRLPEGRFLVVAGDFNDAPSESVLRPLLERGLVDQVPGGIDHVLVPASAVGVDEKAGGSWKEETARAERGRWRVVEARWVLRPGEVEALVGPGVALSDHPGLLVVFER